MGYWELLSERQWQHDDGSGGSESVYNVWHDGVKQPDRHVVRREWPRPSYTFTGFKSVVVEQGP
jgi:hypothetical protein